jgi:serine/threonine protein kinase
MGNVSSCEHQPFVLKSVSQSIFEHSQELRHRVGGRSRLRTHIDENEEEHTLIYEYFNGNLLSFVKNNPDLPMETRKFILREVGLGLKDLHCNDWIHLGTMR